MTTQPILLALVLAAAPAAGAEVQWVERFRVSSPSEDSQWETRPTGGHPDFTIEPDAAVLVYKRGEYREVVLPQPRRYELVYVGLSTGRQLSTVEVPYSFTHTPLVISRDGATVVCWRQESGADYQPFWASVWRPLTGKTTLTDYDYQHYTLEHNFERARYLDPLRPAPSLSPDGTRVAFFAHYYRSHYVKGQGPVQEPSSEAVGILDLESGRSSAISLPVNVNVALSGEWFLSWSEDGSVIWAVAPDRHDSDDTAKCAKELASDHTSGANLTLYRCSLSDGKATPVGPVPAHIIGFGANDTIILSNIDEERRALHPTRWRRTGFAMLPISDLMARASMGRDALASFSAGLEPVPVELPGGETTDRVTAVFVGKTRTFAIVTTVKEHVATYHVLERVTKPAVK